MSDEQQSSRASPPMLGGARVAIGLLQGLALFGLHRAFDFKAWPATAGPVFGALLLAAAFAPLILLAGLGRLRRLTLGIWVLAAAAVAGVLAAYNVSGAVPETARITPDFQVWAFTAVGLFIAHHLIVPADAERRWVAHYLAYFDAAWLNAVQLALAIAFTGAFWVLLELGAALFGLIGLKGFAEFIKHDWFYFPALGVAFATAVHLADVRVGLIRGLRSVGLVLLSWLLPLMTIIAIAFLAALLFTGLAPLWKAGAATGVLLGAITALIVLVNAAYQDGAPVTSAPFVLRWSARATSLALVPLAAVALWGLWLRIGQHGLTPQRIIAAAVAAIAVFYALGYAWAAVRPGRWMRRLEWVNVANAVVILAVILALFTPIADPTRIAVADQVARLERGQTKAADFDVFFLRDRAGRYGVEALERMRRSRNAQIAALAIEARNAAIRPALPVAQPGRLRPLAERITVYPPGGTLPADFLALKRPLPPLGEPCNAASCDAYFVDLRGDGTREILVRDLYELSVWAKPSPAQPWTQIGRFAFDRCPGAVEALRAGTLRPITRPSWPDLRAGDWRLMFEPSNDAPSCEPSAPNTSR